MNRNYQLFKFLLLSMCFQFICIVYAAAQEEKYSALPLTGINNQIAKDSSSSVQDTVFANLTQRATQTTNSVQDFVTFKLNEFGNIAIPDSFKVTITFKVYFTKLVGVNDVLDSSSLQTVFIEYNKLRSYQSKAVYTYTGGFKSQVKIFSVTSNLGTFSAYKNALMLENTIVVNRTYNFNPNADVIQTISGLLGSLNDADSCSSAGEFMVSWGKIKSITEYDLEWTYIDSTAVPNYYINGTSTLDRKKLFKNNATRVTITSENYQIPLLYDNGGILYYRVRPVQVRPTGQRIEGQWSSFYTGGLGVYGFLGHEKKLNWQASTSYAEEGKRKSVVQYFDGTLRNRQTITKDNNTCFTIAAETLYDYQGRPVIQVMPAPTLNRLIGYTANLNNTVANAPYNKSIFDGDATPTDNNCSAILPGMDTLSGASKYYSPSNPLVNNDFNRFIPDANLYPFTETRYTPDNTGRIAMQGGVGKEFQINDISSATYSHETRYFYSAADQEDLNALFGTEAGNAAHYAKNMVRDANGQYSVSYVDMHGRTIATALAGKPIAKLDTLKSGNNKLITKKLLDTTNNLIFGSSIISSKNLLVTMSGAHRFQYSVVADSIGIKACNNNVICYDCLYDLQISISNDCANPNNQPILITRTNFPLNSNIDSFLSCNVIPPLPSVDTSINLSEGSYTITKTLSVSPAAFKGYSEIFLQQNTCRTQQQIIDSVKNALLNLIQCEPSCKKCTDSLGTAESFRIRYMLNNNIPPSDSAAFRGQALLAYQVQADACNLLCEATGLHTSVRTQMLADMTPPDGQYAEIDSAFRDPLNIFAYSNIDKKYNFQFTGASNYKNEFGLPDSIINSQGVKVPPSDASVTPMDFLNNWKLTWAETLLPLHPEYCKLIKMESYAASYVWDERFSKIQTFKQARDSGFLNPCGFTQPTYLPSGSPFNSPLLAARDPFFITLETNYLAPFRDSLLSYAKDFISYTPAINAWSVATIMAHCKQNDMDCLNLFRPLSTAFTLDSACSGELDFAWRYFREMYLIKKAQIIDKIIENVSCPGYVNASKEIYDWHTLNFNPINAQDAKSGIPNSASAGTDSLNSFIDENCRAYVKQWLNELRPCNLTTNDTTQLLPRLIAVCKAGGDLTHAYGSSTTKPGTYTTGTYSDSSFIQVLKSVLTTRYDSTCNGYLITAPQPYDKQPAYSDIELNTKPDTCQCNKINNYYSQYQQSGSDPTFADFIFRKTGVKIYQGVLDSLRMLCNGQITCSFLATPLVIPPALQCNTGAACASCYEVNSVYLNFKTAFPGIVPVYADNDSFQIKRNRLFENFMNYNLGFSKTAGEYLDFLDKCAGTGLVSPCDSLNTILNNFITLNKPGGITYTLYNTNGGTRYSDIPSLADTGSIHFPNSVRTGNSGYYHAFEFKPANNKTFCTSNGYSVEVKFKLSPFTTTGDILYTLWGNKNILVRRNGTLGLYTNSFGTGANYILDSDPNAITRWVTLKMKILPNRFYIYFNGKTVFDSTLATPVSIGNKSVFSTNMIGPQVIVDHVKMWDNSDNLKYYEDFNNPSNLAFVDSSFICPVTSCTASFTTYFNTQKGTNYSYSKIDSLYMVKCGIHPSPCVMPTSCNVLDQLIADYQNRYIRPYTGYVDYEMRTFAGNRTPDAGSKGVFDVNKNLIGNTVTGTPLQIKQSFAQIWNSNAANQVIGTLSVLPDLKLRLTLNPGKLAPCDGIIGMRYFQFDFSHDTLDAVRFSKGTYIDFGDGTRTYLTKNMNTTNTITSNWADSPRATQYYSYHPDLNAYPIGSADNAIHFYPSKATKTVTVYHTDTLGYMGFDNYQYTAAYLSNVSKLRGYAPQQLIGFGFNSTSNTTVNTTDSLYNFSSINTIRFMGFNNGDKNDNSASIFKNNNFAAFTQNHSLTNIDFKQGGLYDYTPPGAKKFKDLWPNLPVNFPEMTSISLHNFADEYTSDVNFSLPKLRHLYIAAGTLTSLQIDSIIIQVARSTQDSGYLGIHNWYTGPSRTSLSNAAYNSLAVRGWSLGGSGMSNTQNGWSRSIPLTIPDSLPYSNNFTEFYNQRYNTNYGYNQLMAVLKSKYGYIPDVCNPVSKTCNNYVSATGLMLCGSPNALFSPIDAASLSPCGDSTLFSVGVGTKIYNAYQDSLKESFANRYLDKCLKARYTESFKVTAPTSEFHYTLYFYDQAGNLVKTIPPEGVDVSKFGDTTFNNSVKTARNQNQLLTPVHVLATQYRYNSLNQVVTQITPDAGISNFFYDKIGRLVLSQNAKQKAAGYPNDSLSLYSYTLYDALGRINEVGQIRNTAPFELVTNTLTRTRRSTWFNNHMLTRHQFTKTLYDLKYSGLVGSENQTIWQRNLRNRVSSLTYYDTSSQNYASATYYTYDIAGNVDTLLQDYGYGGTSNFMNVHSVNVNRFKRLVYSYDLISGKVNFVAFQPPRGNTYYPDMFYHRYSYDAENRLTLAETSADSIVWEKDARYTYYLHGPLARTTTGEQLVQGTDYAYTLQGWLKGVNAINLSSADYDMGNDGKAGSLNRYTAKDALGFNLNYFSGDYTPIQTNVSPFPDHSPYINTPATNYRPLYNGNISSMAVNIKYPSATAVQAPQLYNYSYDQLNRITGMDVYRCATLNTNSWSGMLPVDDYKERVSYDANGNILKYLRQGYGSNLPMDSLRYNYNYTSGRLANNKLNYVTDKNGSTAYSTNYTEDIEDQAAGNYTYDAIGNLVTDVKEGVTNIEWNVYGKITKITRTPTAANSVTSIKYTYDPSGNRIIKAVTKSAADSVEYTGYARDASGNIMCTYFSKDAPNGTLNSSSPLLLQEQTLYGSSRVGILNRNINVGTSFTKPNIVNFIRGNKIFQLSNHLGNVLVTISDKKIGVDVAPADGIIDYYNADVVTANDYYPGGMQMPGRKYQQGTASYRFGFGGMEKSNEIKGEGNSYTAEFWEYDPRLVRRWNVDPKPTVGLSDYATFLNNPIWHTDVYGDTPTVKQAALMSNNSYSKFDPNNKQQLELKKAGWNRVEKITTNMFGKSNQEVSLDDIGAVSGYNMALYSKTLNGKTEWVLANAGTADVVDVGSDGKQVTGSSDQYAFSIRVARSLQNGMNGQEMTYVGHSLGGGLAAANSLATGNAAITFNPAGVSWGTRATNGLPKDKRDGQIKSFVVGGEAVDRSQRLVGSKANGQITYIHPQYGLINSGTAMALRFSTDVITSVQYHMMSTVMQSLDKAGIK